MEKRQTILLLIWKNESFLWERDCFEKLNSKRGLCGDSGPCYVCTQGFVWEAERKWPTEGIVWTSSASGRALASLLPKYTKNTQTSHWSSRHQHPHVFIMTPIIWSCADNFIQSLQCTIFYIQILLSIWQHLILFVFLVHREWIYLTIVTAWHFYKHPHWSESAILSFLFLLTNVLMVSRFG